MITVEQRCADIDDDGDVHPHFADNVQRNIVDHSTVHQQPPIEFDRSEHRRDRHAGADDLGQMPAAKDHFLAIGDVGGHGPERDWQFVEITGVAGVRQQTFELQ
ncbi:hypothetical protein D9M73_228510 [compost metagenome]